MPETFKELVHLALQKDQDAISELYQRTYNGVYRTVKTLIKDDDTALDVTQDTFVKAFDSLDQLQEPEKLQSWINQIAANKSRDYLKKKRPALFTEMENEDGEMAEFADDCIDHLPEEVLDREETARLLKEILDTLPEEQRAVLFMMHYEQMSVKEIAQALDCSENTVKSRLNYGRKKVKAAVEDLEKKGTKLYSLAPMPFLLWLLRMAKTENIPVSSFYPAVGTAAGVASQAAEVIGGQVAEGAAKSTAKTAAKAGAKALSKKIVAGVLAVTVAGGAGAVAVNTLHSTERENAAAHAVYEEFLDRYKVVLESDYEVILADQNQFWTEIDQNIWEQNPDADPNVYNSWYLEYTPGEDFQVEGFRKGIPVPDTLYDPNMDMQWLLTYFRLEEEELLFAYHDANGDGIDEMFIAMFYRGELQKVKMDVYTVCDGKLVRGSVDFHFYEDRTEWELKPTSEMEYVNSNDIVYINMGAEAFIPSAVIREPNCEWQKFCNYSGSNNLNSEKENATAPTEETVFRDPQLNQEAHGVFEDFLEQNTRYDQGDCDRFWSELGIALYNAYGEDAALLSNEFVYTPGEGYSPEVPLPDTHFKPNMFARYGLSGVWVYTYQDINSDGIDDLLVRDSNSSSYIYAYFFVDGKLMHACIKPCLSEPDTGYWCIDQIRQYTIIPFMNESFTFTPVVITADPKTFPNSTKFAVPDSLDWVPLL